MEETLLSIIVPVYNEEESIEYFLEHVDLVLESF